MINNNADSHLLSIQHITKGKRAGYFCPAQLGACLLAFGVEPGWPPFRDITIQVIKSSLMIIDNIVVDNH